MSISRSALLGALALMSLNLPVSGGAAQTATSDSNNGKLAACPSAPHCVSSDDTDTKRQIPALQIKGDPAKAWATLKAELDKLPRTKTVEDRADYRRVVVTTRLLRFKDDVEFQYRPERGEIAMRSTSNVGYYDFNANRNRLEAIRSTLRQQGVVE
jgi:uncharacterized protein (DUF1499 family)